MNVMKQGLFVFEEKKEDGSYGEPSVVYQTSLSAGFDLPAAEDASIEPGKWALVDTGLRIKDSPGTDTLALAGTNLEVVQELQIRPRSGLAAKKGITVLNSPGTVDADYRGPIKVILINHGQETFIIKKGERIAQGVVALVVRGSVPVKEKDRGEGGFGSTNVKTPEKNG